MGKNQINRFVIKCGGSTLSALPDSFYSELGELQKEGYAPVIVHGGGPAISAALEKYEIETEFVGGLRKTTEPVLDIVEMVLSGQMNKEVVRRINRAGGKAVGLSGVDGQLIEADRWPSEEDIGFVGEVKNVNAELLTLLIDAGFIPVIAPIGIDRSGQRYNINADTAAGAVASHLGVTRMIVITDVPGIMRPVDGELTVMPEVTIAEIDRMIEEGIIYGGMIPKVKAAIECLQGDVEQVVIVSGEERQVLTRLLAGEAIGTVIRRNE